MLKVCHLTTIHYRYDARVFMKECRSLARHYEVHLVVSDGLGDEIKDGVHIHDTGVKPVSLFSRLFKLVRETYRTAVRLDCDVYHFHDPEFLPAAWRLIAKGKRVIYDTHEDMPRAFGYKEYLGIFKRPAGFIFEIIENWFARRMTAIVAATPHIRKRFEKIHPLSININNYPSLTELNLQLPEGANRNNFAYIGGLTREKGFSELIDAFADIPVKLEVAGPFQPEDFKNDIVTRPGWQKVKYHGKVSRSLALDILKRSRAGLVVFNPVPNYINALPIKMFEYMSAGIPVIASNFPDWKAIVEDNGCGVCADPLDPKDIAEKIMLIASNDEMADAMGKRGLEMVREEFNWEREEIKLLQFYTRVLA